MTANRLTLLVAFVLPLAATVPAVADGSAPVSASPTPAPLNPHDRLVQEIEKLDRFLLDPRIPAEKRQRLTEARNALDARRLRMEADAARSAASPRR